MGGGGDYTLKKIDRRPHCGGGRGNDKTGLETSRIGKQAILLEKGGAAFFPSARLKKSREMPEHEIPIQELFGGNNKKNSCNPAKGVQSGTHF